MAIEKKYWKEIWLLTGEDVKQLPIMVVLFIISSFFDLAGLGLIVPYVAMILDASYIDKLKQNNFIDELTSHLADSTFIFYTGLVLVLIFFLKLFIVYLINKKIMVFSYQKMVKIRAQLMSYYQAMPYETYLKRNSSEYVYTITSLASIFAESTLQSVIRLISEGILLFAVFCLLLAYSGVEFIYFTLLLGASALLYDKFYRKRIVQDGKVIDVKTKRIIQGVHEAIEGLKELRVLGKEFYFYNKVISSAQEVADARISTNTIRAMPRYILEFILILFVVILVYLTIHRKGDMVALASMLSMFGAAAMRLIPSVNQIISCTSQISHNRNAVSMLYKDMLELQNAGKDLTSGLPSSQSRNFETVSLDAVTYRYENATQNALQDVSILIRKGESIGLIGTSGAGKSTLVDLLLGLLKPQTGRILYNDIQLSENNMQLFLQRVAYVPQQIFIVDDSIRKNIALGTSENEIDDSRVLDALDKANLNELLTQLPHGLDTMLGERGVRLSGGQRQRIAIARTFYYERDILIMDEATSALDTKTENEIVEEIRRLKGKKTLVVIAHRLSTISNCDRIYRLEHGRIVDEGTYASVIKKNS
jgi:ABC-type multidrug transport system fused ATPase/permease subunit